MPKKKSRTAAEIRQDEYDSMIRRCLGLIAVYQEMLESFLRCNAFDEETRQAHDRH